MAQSQNVEPAAPVPVTTSAASKVVDTSLVRNIDQDQGVMFFSVFGCIGFVALGLWMIGGNFSEYRRAALTPFSGWIMVVLFGLFGAVLASRLLNPRNPIITLSPEGIRDQRIGRDVLPWKHITGIKDWRLKLSKAVVLFVDPAALKDFNWSLTHRILRPLNAMSGRGLHCSAMGTKIDHAELLTLISAYANDHGKLAMRPSST